MYVIYGDTIGYQYMHAGADKELVLNNFINEVKENGELPELGNVFVTVDNEESVELQNLINKIVEDANK
jgi:hypothetical protein